MPLLILRTSRGRELQKQVAIEVAVTNPDWRKRFILFEKGEPISIDLSQADGDMTFKFTKQGYLFMVQAGRERYEIPEAVVFWWLPVVGPP